MRIYLAQPGVIRKDGCIGAIIQADARAVWPSFPGGLVIPCFEMPHGCVQSASERIGG